MTSFTLANGMKVIVHQDKDIPNVGLYLFFKIGSRNERPGTTGISHFFEHMMFNGAKKYGPKQFDIQMEKNGGRNNAYTSRDITAYTDWFPRTALDLMFDMEADRIKDLAFDPKIIESERGVVYSERRSSVDNNNAGLLDEQLSAAAYTAHPYGWPVVGWPTDIESWTMDDLKAHFAMGYAPNNCIVVVTGDVTVEEITALAKKYFEPIPKHDPPPVVRTKEPVQRGERRVTVRKPAELPMVMISYHVPESKHQDALVLDMLASILLNGHSSRLYRSMVDKQSLALDIDGGRQDSMDPGQFQINIQVRDGVQPEAMEKALYAEIETVSTKGVTAEEVEKARNQLLTSFYRDLRTIAGKANLIGQTEVFRGDYRKLNTYAADLAAIKAADIQRVAKAYLHQDNRTVATLIPTTEAK
jgi:zinc protease